MQDLCTMCRETELEGLAAGTDEFLREVAVFLKSRGRKICG